MDRATHPLVLAASLSLFACKDSVELEQICKSTVFVGRVSPGNACTEHGGWTGEPLGDVGLLNEFCEYRWSGGGEPVIAELPEEDAGVSGLVESCPRVIPQSDAFAGLEDLRGHLHEAFMRAIGRVSILPHVSDALPRVYIVDTIPESLLTEKLVANDFHGQRLRELTEGILCDSSAGCPSVIVNTLGLPRLTPTLIDRVHGGSFGSLMDLARGITDAVNDWEQHGGSQNLVLALAVGWEPLGAYGPDLADKSLEALLTPDGAATDAQAVLASLTRAACHGALIVAAVGNSTGEACVQTGVMGPAMLASLPSPTAAQCEAMGFPHAKTAAASSLLLSVSHVGLAGQQLGNARADASGGVTAQGSTFSTPGGDTGLMTGSSVATIVSTTAAAALWAVYPGLTRAEVTASIQHTVDESTGVSICNALLDACKTSGDQACDRFTCPDAHFEADMANREISAVLQPPCSPHDCSTEIDVSAPFPTAQSLGDNACGVPLTMFSSVMLPEISEESSYPWTTPQPKKPYCPTCLAELRPMPQRLTVGISLVNAPDGSYPLFIEVESASGVERYPIDSDQLARGDDSVTLVHIQPERPWDEVKSARLLYYVKSSNGRWHTECDPLLLRIIRSCGNGTIESGEQCDDGNDVDGGPGDFCKNDCSIFVPPTCQAPINYIVCDENLDLADKTDKTTVLKAMGICNDLPKNSVQFSNFQFKAADDASWQVAKGFGSYIVDDDMDPNTPDNLLYSPREGESMLLISTGRIAAPNGDGVVIESGSSQVSNGSNDNDDEPDSLPAPLSDKLGSNNGAGETPFMQCDGVNDCSDTLFDQWNNIAQGNPNDKLFFRFNTTVPAATYGYTFDFVFCASEWPTWIDSSYNDMFIVWQSDPTPDDPNADRPVDAYTGNITFIPDPNDPTHGLPLTTSSLDAYFMGPGYSGNEPQLSGTGFETNACSDWFTAKGSVRPGANLDVGFFLADMGDDLLATMAIIDNFRWICEGCIPSAVDDCGVLIEQFCGNGKTEQDEECDDGNMDNTDSCDSMCKTVAP